MARRVPFSLLLLALLLVACGEDGAETSPGQEITSLSGTTTAPTDAEDCRPSGQFGDETLFLCWRPGGYGRFLFVAGETKRELDVKAPTKVGHWVWARLSPDGRTILAQWSAECEVPVAYLISAEGGRPREAVRAYASHAIRWTRAGRAVVEVVESACGTTAPRPGFYLVDPKGETTGPFKHRPR
jgi:hypothetical protein